MHSAPYRNVILFAWTSLARSLMREACARRFENLVSGNLVQLHGYTPEKELNKVLEKSHLAINLRYPTMGEASGSQLRIWYHALPSSGDRRGLVLLFVARYCGPCPSDTRESPTSSLTCRLSSKTRSRLR